MLQNCTRLLHLRLWLVPDGQVLVPDGQVQVSLTGRLFWLFRLIVVIMVFIGHSFRALFGHQTTLARGNVMDNYLYPLGFFHKG